MNFLRRTSLFVEILTLIYNSHRDSAKNLLMFVMLIPYVFQIRCCCRTTRILLSVLVIQLRHGLIISCPPPQDIPYYRMSMLKGDYISSDHLPLCFNVIVNNAINCVY